MTKRGKTRYFPRSHNLLLAAVMAAGSLLMSSCGGGGGGVPAERPDTHISGTGFDGPIQNGQIAIYDFTGGTKGALLASSQTDVDGLFEVNLTVSSRPLWAELTGGRYKEEASSRVIDLEAGQSLRAAVNYTSGQHFGLSVTAFSTMSAGLAEFLIASGVEPAEAIRQANSRISQMLGDGVDVTATQPLDITDVRNQDATLSPGLQYGFITASISNFIDWVNQENGQELFSSVEFAQLAYDDIKADGRLDGQRAAGPIALGRVTVTADTYRNVLAENILAVAASPNNVTAVEPRNLIETAIAYTSAPDGDQLFGDTPSLPFANVAPNVGNISPTTNSVVAGSITVSASITDLVGLESVRFLVDGTQVAMASGNLQNAQGIIDTTAFEDGPHTLTISAKNLVGNETGVNIPITVANFGTSIANITPNNGALVRGSFTIAADVADPSGIASVVFDANGTGGPNQRITATNPAKPSATVNSTSYDDGALGVSITATNNVGNSKTQDVDYTIDNTKPKVTFNLATNTGPVSNGGVVSGNLNVSGSATDANGIERAELLVDGQMRQSFPTPDKITAAIDTTKESDGQRALALVATDKAGNTENQARNVIVDNNPPVIVVTNPAGGDTVSGTLEIAATVTDKATAVSSLKILFNGAEQQNTSSLPNVSTNIDLTGLSGSKALSIEAIDQAGHRAFTEFNVIVDNDAPKLTLNGLAEGQVVKGTLNLTASASDPSGIISATFTLNNQVIKQFAAGSDFANMAVSVDTAGISDGSATLKVLVQDGQGSSNTLTRRFTVDNTNPQLNVASPTDNQVVDGSLSIKGTVTDATAVSLQLVLASTPAQNVPIVAGAFDLTRSTSGIAEGRQSVTLTAKDEANNSTTRNISILVDNTIPVIDRLNLLSGQHVRGTFTVTARAQDANGSNGSGLDSVAFFFSGARVATATSGFNNLSVDIDSSQAQDGTRLLRIEAKDKAGNVGFTEVSLVVDNTAPTLDVPSEPVTANASSADGAVVDYSASVASSDSLSCTPASGSAFPIGSTTVSCTASDQAGNTTQKSFAVVVADTGAPVINAGSVPKPDPVEATSAAGATVTYTKPTATDNVDPKPVVSCSPASGSVFAIAKTTVSCTATDSTGLTSAAATFDITVRDTTKPSIAGVPANISVDASSSSGVVVSYAAPTATDVVDGNVPVSCSPTSGSTFAVGETTVNCSATDSHSNTATATFKVTVADTGSPVITASSVPSPAPVEATGPTGANVTYSKPTATDNVDPNPTVSCTPASGSTFALGTTAVSCVATDNTGLKSAAATFDVIVRDTTKPSFSNVPADITANATSGSGAQVSYTKPTATDLVDGSVTVTCTPASGSPFAMGTTTVNCSAKDSRDNTATTSFKVTVADNSAPTINAGSIPSPAPVEATSASGAIVTYTKPSASDNVDPSPTVTCSPVSGSTFAIKTTQVSCTAKDSTGLTSAAAVFNVTVVDSTKPTFANVPSNITEPATSASGAVVAYTKPTATDIVDGSVNVTCSPASGSTFAIGSTTVNCSATDSATNTNTVSFTVSVVDSGAPTINSASVPSPITREATSALGAAVTYTLPTASDNVDPNPTVTCLPVSGSVFEIGTSTVSCTAKDSGGTTSAPATFSVTVQDTTGPVISNVPSNIFEIADSNLGSVINYSLPTANDTVDGNVAVTCSPAPGFLFPVGLTTVTCDAQDSRGNPAASVSFTVELTAPSTP